MSYRAIPNKKAPKRFKRVLWRKYVKDEKTGEYVSKDRHVPVKEYPQLGITQEMSLEEVKAILKKLNLEEDRRQREDRRNTVAIRMAVDAEIECIHLPKPFVLKFEQDHLAMKYQGSDERLKKMLKLWRAGQKVIRTINVSMDKWHRYPQNFYSYFEKKSFSPGYVKNIMSVVNMWVEFLGYEQEKLYRLVPAPDSTWKSKVNRAFKKTDNSTESLPITPEMLSNAKPPLSEEQANWVYCSIWAGLRPSEATALLNKQQTKISYRDGMPILEVYQSKLQNLPNEEDQWKHIPLFLPEQQKIIEIIASKKIEEPLSKTLQSRFGEGHTLYGGRKGFESLMVDGYGQNELHVSNWLGHRSYNMTKKHYTQKNVVRWTPLKKKAS